MLRQVWSASVARFSAPDDAARGFGMTAGICARWCCRPWPERKLQRGKPIGHVTEHVPTSGRATALDNCQRVVTWPSNGHVLIGAAMRGAAPPTTLCFAVYSLCKWLTFGPHELEQNIPCRRGKDRDTLAAFACYSQLVVAPVPLCQFGTGDFFLSQFELFRKSVSWIHAVPAGASAQPSPSTADKSLTIVDDRVTRRR